MGGITSGGDTTVTAAGLQAINEVTRTGHELFFELRASNDSTDGNRLGRAHSPSNCSRSDFSTCAQISTTYFPVGRDKFSATKMSGWSPVHVGSNAKPGMFDVASIVRPGSSEKSGWKIVLTAEAKLYFHFSSSERLTLHNSWPVQFSRLRRKQ